MDKLKLLSFKIPGPDGTSTEIQAPPGIPTGDMTTSGKNILSLGIDLLLLFVVFFAFGFIMWGGFKWISSHGDKDKIEEARKTITYAVLGLVIAFLSFFVLQLLGGLFGIDLLKVSL